MTAKTTAEWQEIPQSHGNWHAPVLDYDAVAEDPQVRHNRSFETVPGAEGHPVTLVGHPVRYDGRAPETRLPPQRLGAQSGEILRELGYDDGDIERLTAEGTVGVCRDA